MWIVWLLVLVATLTIAIRFDTRPPRRKQRRGEGLEVLDLRIQERGRDIRDL